MYASRRIDFAAHLHAIIQSSCQHIIILAHNANGNMGEWWHSNRNHTNNAANAKCTVPLHEKCKVGNYLEKIALTACIKVVLTFHWHSIR